MFFAGIHVPQWTSVRKVKDGLIVAEDIALLVAERIEPPAPGVRHDNDVTALPAFDGPTRTFLQVDFVAGLL